MIHTVFFFFIIYDNVDNLFSICDQTFVSEQCKAKLHQHQIFCILSVLRSCVHKTQNPSTYYFQNKISFTLDLWSVGSSEHGVILPKLMNRGWKYPMKIRKGWRYSLEREKIGALQFVSSMSQFHFWHVSSGYTEWALIHLP